MPPLTPGTNKKLTEVLKASFASWEKEAQHCNITKGKFQSYHNIIKLSISGVPLHLCGSVQVRCLYVYGTWPIGFKRGDFFGVAIQKSRNKNIYLWTTKPLNHRYGGYDFIIGNSECFEPFSCWWYRFEHEWLVVSLTNQ